MFAHFEAIKFEPKLTKSSTKLLGMLSAVNEVEASLNTAVRQMPMKDSGVEKIRTIKEVAQCQ
jgi:hypothetical protein